MNSSNPPMNVLRACLSSCTKQKQHNKTTFNPNPIEGFHHIHLHYSIWHEVSFDLAIYFAHKVQKRNVYHVMSQLFMNESLLHSDALINDIISCIINIWINTYETITTTITTSITLKSEYGFHLMSQ